MKSSVSPKQLKETQQTSKLTDRASSWKGVSRCLRGKDVFVVLQCRQWKQLSAHGPAPCRAPCSQLARCCTRWCQHELAERRLLAQSETGLRKTERYRPKGEEHSLFTDHSSCFHFSWNPYSPLTQALQIPLDPQFYHHCMKNIVI